jgi:hypothetical protein
MYMPTNFDCFAKIIGCTCQLGGARLQSGLLGSIFLPRSAAASGDELWDLSAEGTGPIPILSLPRFHYGSFACFLVAYFDEFFFFYFFFWLFGSQELEPTEIRDVLRCKYSDLSFSHPLSFIYLRWKGSFVTSTNCSLLTRHGNPMYCSNVLYSFTCFFVVMVLIIFEIK